MSTAAILALAMCLDAMFGEPRLLWSRVPHPAILMGKVVGALDQKLNSGGRTRAKGVLAIATLVLGAGVTGWVLSQFGGLVTWLIAAILLAQRSLTDHVNAVSDALRLSSEAGRRAVQSIVSRDVTTASPADTARAAIESLSENFSDGVIAPAFWFLVAGLPGILVYKAINTADSMIGYMTPRYMEFGWASARLDDLMNWVPARLTAGLIALVGRATHERGAIARDAKLHRSPNAGWPEAAMAHALGIALAGPRSYHGQVQDLAWVNGAGRRALIPTDIDAAVSLVWKAWALVVAGLFLWGGLAWVF